MKGRRKFGWGGKEPCLHFCWTDGSCTRRKMTEPADFCCPVWSSNGRRGCKDYLPLDPNKPMGEALKENPPLTPITVMFTEEELEALRKGEE